MKYNPSVAKSKKIDISELGDWLASQMHEYDVDVQYQLLQAIEKTSKETKNIIKEETPKGNRKKKHYRSHFTIRKPSGNEKLFRVLWNTEYQLSHLLEDGHKVYSRIGRKKDLASIKTGPLPIRNSKYGTVGYTTKDFKMWKNAQDNASVFLYDFVVDGLKKIK